MARESVRDTAALTPRQTALLKCLGIARVWVAEPAPLWIMLALMQAYG
jgi:hypothetical protein